MTYLKDLIDIRDHVGSGDFVLRLSEGVTDPVGTVKHYQVTPPLVKNFDEALGLIKGALAGPNGRTSSKAAYLHGSFGSGKSHFMAILYLLMHGDANARSIPEVAEVITKHNAWTQGKKFLMVPFHLMDAKNLESAILGGYASYIERNHPDAPIPAIYRAEGLLQNAEQLRAKMGDAIFFEGLNEKKSVSISGGGGWGSINAKWDAVRYANALQSNPNSEECRKLVRDLVDTHLPAMKNTEEFVDLDDGLAILSAHAKEIGYDALVLFLDELILWLASKAGDPAFVSREGNKVVKLVESNRADRPVPIISFIARQRDLRDMIGQHIAGAERLAFADVLDHHEGRFGVINLEDRNLPAIAEKRILLPKSEAARQQMDAEFARTSTLREEVMKTLLTRKSNRDDFRKLYPFSPALVDTLVAVSSLLQRERTALKVMAMLLSSQKETLQLGQMVPVGDLFDQVSQGDEAFSSDMKIHFENANRLYRQHLKPLLEKEHNLTFEEAEAMDWNDPKRAALRNDDRLMKTVLLAALVPEVEALKDMTPARLAALNHGTILSPIAGQEATTVINKFKKWAAAAGQIKITEGAGSTLISIQLSTVDTEQILAKASAVDNNGNRIRKVKELMFKALGRENEDQLYYTHEFKWRGTPREASVIFTNIRELGSDSLICKGNGWKVIIDYPFDQSGHTVRDDIAKIETFQSEEEATRTICWIPSFFNAQSMDALGTLVRLDQILKDNQFPNYVQHLNETDRQSAKSQLESQRDQLRSQILSRIEMAYGIRGGGEDYLDDGNLLDASEQFRSLDPSIHLQAPVAANLEQGLTALLDQALRQQYPKHPHFDDKISLTKGALTKVLEVIREAAGSTEPSVMVDPAMRRQMQQFGNLLKLGEMGETRFQLGQSWKTHFNKQAAQSNGALTVGKLRKWTDEPEAMGLPEPIQDLLILAYAEQTNRVFKYHLGPAVAEIGSLDDEMTIEEVALPEEQDWTLALERAKALFGIPTSPLLNAVNVTALGEAVHTKVVDLTGPLQSLIGRLESIRVSAFESGPCARLDTAREGLLLLKTLEGMQGNTLIGRLAGFNLTGKPAVLASSMASATRLNQALENADWEIFEGVRNLNDERKAAADGIWQDLETAFASDEHAIALLPKMNELRGLAVKLLTRPAPASKPAASAPVEPDPIEPVPVPAKTTQQLKRLYGKSQVDGDRLPDWVKPDDVMNLLRVRCVGSDPEDWRSLIVVSPLYDELIQLDAGAKLDLASATLTLPRFGKELKLTVHPQHLES
jgi:hypothetical protein